MATPKDTHAQKVKENLSLFSEKREIHFPYPYSGVTFPPDPALANSFHVALHVRHFQ